MAACLGVAAWGQAGAPPAAAIEPRLIANFKRDQAAMQRYTHREHVVVDKDGAIDGRTLQVWWVNGREVNETIALDNRQLSQQELAAEHVRAMQRAEAASRRKPPTMGTLNFDGHSYPFSRLAKDYLYGTPTTRMWHGREVWVYPATPNPNTPARSAAEKLLLHSEGAVWVDAQDMHVMRISMHLTAPVKYALGILATIPSANLDLQLERQAPGIWLPASADFHLRATILLLKHLVRSKEQTFFDYRPAGGNSQTRTDPATKN